MTSMEVSFVGWRRGAPDRELCGTDAVEQEEIQDSETVVTITTSAGSHCFLLRTLAKWFVEYAITWNRLPFLPTTGEVVTSEVYGRVIREASELVPGHRAYMNGAVGHLPATCRLFVLAEEDPVPESFDLDHLVRNANEDMSEPNEPNEPSDVLSLEDLLETYAWSMNDIQSMTRTPRTPR